MEVSVIDHKGKETGRKVVLSEDIFGVEPNDHVIYLDIKQYLANQRQGTHKSKERNEIVGSTKKIKKQKGTGTARAGSIKSPVFRGGGRIFGPKPRNYGFKLNKKVKTVARISALSYKAKDNKIVIVEDFSFDLPKTKEYTKFIQAVAGSTKKSLFITADKNENMYLSSRNLKEAKVTAASGINTYDILNADTLIVAEKAIDNLKELLTK